MLPPAHSLKSFESAAEQAAAPQQAAEQAVAAQTGESTDQLEDGVVNDDVTHPEEDQDAEQLAGDDVEYDLGDETKGGA